MKISEKEPASLAEAIRLVFLALAAVGWVTLDDETIQAVTLGICAVVSVVCTVFVRRRVTPVSKS